MSNEAGMTAGNSDMITRKYLDSLLVEMRIVGSELASTEADFFGHRLSTPVMFGVMGGLESRAGARAEQCEAVKELGTVLWYAGHTSDEDKDVIAKSGVMAVEIIKPVPDNEEMIRQYKAAEARGCIAVGTDIDHAWGRDGSYDHMRNGKQLGPKSTEELHALVESVDIPVIGKGVLSVHDAVKCKEAGMKAILISHHHGIMDFAVPPLMLLPEIRKAVGEDYMIIADCGIDTGADVFKALASGANLVCTSRAIMRKVPGGKQAQIDYVREMNAQLRHFMNRTSSPDVSHIDPTVIHKVPFTF